MADPVAPATPDPSQQFQSQVKLPSAGLSKDETVEGRLTGLLNSNSDLLTQARTQGSLDAQNRGLLNSSIATGAAQDAATRAALPIASQDASQAFTRGQSNVQTQQASALSGQETAQAGLLSSQQAQQQSALSTQQAGQQQSQATLQGGIDRLNQINQREQSGILSAQEAQQQRDTLGVQYGLQSGLSAQQATQALTAQTQAEGSRSALSGQEFQQSSALAQFNAGAAQQLAQLETGNRLLLQTNDSAAASYRTMVDQINQIQQNTNLDKNTKATDIGNIITYYQSYFDLQSSILTAGGLATTPGALPGAPPGVAPVTLPKAGSTQPPSPAPPPPRNPGPPDTP